MFRRGRRRWPARVVGVLATAALLGAGVVMAQMIASIWDDEDAAEPPAVVAAEAGGGEPALTRAQRRARRAAAATLRQQGFEPVRLTDYNPTSRLRVLVGDDGGLRRAFFFARRRFAGYDAETSSGQLRVVRAGDRAVTLSYGLYQSGDKRCCPQAGTEEIRFVLEDGDVVSRRNVPPAGARVPFG